MMSHTLYAIIVGSSTTDEISAKFLVAKVVLKLLERALHEKWCERMNCRYKTLYRQASGCTNHCLFEYAQVQDTLRECWIIFVEKAIAYVCKQHYQPLVSCHEFFKCRYHLLAHIHCAYVLLC